MPEGFKIADAYVDVVAQVQRSELDTSARQVGQRAGGIIGDGVSKGTSDRIRDSRGKFVSAGSGLGDDMGGGLLKSIAGKGTAFAGTLRGLVMSPHALAVVGVAGAALAPALMAGLSGGIMLGAGAGVIGLGYSIVKEEPAVKKASESLGKTVQSVFKKAAQPMVKPFAEAFGLIESMMKRLAPSFNRMFAAMAPAIVPLTKGLTSLVENAMPGLTKLIEASGPFMIEMAPALGKIGEGISIFAREIAKAGPDAALFFKDLLTWIGGVIAGMGYFIGWVARGYGELRAFFTGIGPWVANAYNVVKGWVDAVVGWFQALPGRISGFFSGVWASVTGFFSGLWGTVTGFFGRIGSWFAGLPGRFAGWLAGVWASVTAWWASMGAWFAALPGRIGAFLAALPGVLRTAFTTAMHAALFAVGYAIGSVVKFFIELPGRIVGALSSFRSFIVSSFNSARTSAVNAATNLVNSVVNWLRGLPGKARSAVAALWGSMVGAFNSARSGAASIASSIVNGAVNVLRGLPGKARSAVSGLRSAIVGAAAGAGSWLASAGRNIIQGLIGGIRSMIGSAISAVKSGLSSVVSGAKSALGIGSPSKVFREQVGKWIMPGVTEGVKRTTRKAQGVVARATASLVPDVRPGGIAAGGGLAMAGVGGGGQVVNIGTVTLDASGMKSIQDVVDLVSGISATARSYRARTATPAGR